MTEQNGLERSSATERLRAMLDERGVEWMPIAWNPKRETFYHTSNGVGFCADEYADGVKIYTDAIITPEQAIEATLGSAELRKERDALDRLTDVLNATNDGLIFENSELRELVADLWEYIHIGTAQDGQSLHDRTRELGVEV